MQHIRLTVGIIALAIAGCSQKPKLECSSESAQATTTELVRDQIQQAVDKQIATTENKGNIPRSNIRATLGQLVINLTDIRTSKEDPNSTKRFCTASLHIQAPADLVADAEKVRGTAGLVDIGDIAERDNVDRQYNSFKMSLDYDVQPTDDGNKVFAESTDLPHVRDFFSELIVSALMKPVIEQAELVKQQAAASQQAAERAEKDANLVQAKTENQLANQSITAVWRAITPDVRSSLLSEQRAWIQKKVADCDLESASSSTDPTERDTTKFKCDTRITAERMTALKQYQPTGPTDILPRQATP